MKKLYLLALFWAFTMSVMAQTIDPASGILYVNKNVAGGNQSGNSWQNAIPELADALKWANQNKAKFTTTPLQIWVAGGTYKPKYSPEDGQNFTATPTDPRDVSFLLVKNVQLYGNFAGTETTLAQRTLNTNNKTTLSGDFNDDDSVTGSGATLRITKNTENAYHVLISAGAVGTALLDGFTITGGNANANANTNIIVNSQEIYKYSGGGMYNTSSSPTLSNTTLSGNIATNFGGGMLNTYSSPTLNNTTLSGNNATSGGGMYITTYSSPTLNNTTLSGNNAANFGGGMYNNYSSPILNNTTLSGNNAIYNGGGMYNNSSSSPKIYNSIVFANTAAAAVNIYNSSSTPQFYHSLVQGTTWDAAWGTNNTGNIVTATNPFTTTTNAYTLATGSPAINAGSNQYWININGTITGNETDLAGNPRFVGQIDMGAYENQSRVYTPTNSVLFVNKNVAAGNQSGDSWQNAVPELADALKWANENKAKFTTTPLQIWVAGGTYKPKYSPEDGQNFTATPTDPRDVSFLLVNNVQLYGNFAGTETTLAQRTLNTNNKTTLSGDFNDDDSVTGSGATLSITKNTENAYHVLISANAVGTALLDGFTITGGNANANTNTNTNTNIRVNSQIIYKYYGGGMFNLASSPTLNNTTLSGNNATYNGGGMYNGNSSPRLNNTTLSGNNADSGGGGMFNAYSSPTLNKTTLSGNNASTGGGMFNYTSSPTLNNTTLSGNNATDGGGGMYNFIYSSPTLNNTILSGNNATNEGGGMYNGANSSPKIYNSILFANTAAAGVNIYNSSSTPQFYHSLVQGTTWDAAWGTNNTGNIVTATNPFTTTTNAYTLATGSPAINAGSNQYWININGTITGNETDLAGNPRFVGQIDMGAYENQSLVYTPTNSVLFVNKNVAAGNQSGDSWQNAVPELADALKWANENKDKFTTTPLQIWVAGGTYKPKYSPEDGQNFTATPTDPRDVSFLLVNNVQLYGNFAGTETTLAQRTLNTNNKTTLSGDFNDDDIVTGSGATLSITKNTENAYHVLISANAVGTALLDGFTITGGNTNGSTNTSIIVNSLEIYKYFGGGMYNYTSSPTLNNITLSGNNASNGGGMYNTYSSPTLNNTTLSGNKATDGGGGMFNEDYSSPRLNNTILSGNNANIGGGMLNSVSTPTLNNTTLSGNNAIRDGGGMYNYASTSTLNNTTLSGNKAANSGGGMYNSSSSPKIYNSIMFANTAAAGVDIYNYGSAPQFYHSLVQGTTWDAAWGTNNTGNIVTTTNPFTNPTTNAYTLATGSPAINAGSNQYWIDINGTITGNETDLAGNPRFVGQIDMGAYENQIVVNTPAPTTTATNQAFCIAEVKTIADLAVIGTNIKWYTDKTSITPLNSTDLLVSKSYFATQTVNGLESVDRLEVNVTIYNTPAPTAANQTFCTAEVKTIADLVVIGTDVKWYADNTSITPLNSTDLLVSGNYYATQTVNGCESTRTQVTVSLIFDGLIKQKWNDVLVFDNTSNNYIKWQWFKDGLPINGATNQYYNSPQPLQGTYYVLATDKLGNITKTCSIEITENIQKGGIKIVPNPVQQGQNFTLIANYTPTELNGAKLIITDLTGRLINQITTVNPENILQAPQGTTVYIVYLQFSNGEKVTTKLLVK